MRIDTTRVWVLTKSRSWGGGGREAMSCFFSSRSACRLLLYLEVLALNERVGV